MSQESVQDAIWFKDPNDFRRAHDLLEKVGYREAEVNKLLGLSEIAVPRAVDIPEWRRRTAAPSPLHTLIRVFLIGQPEPLELVRQALAPMSIDSWIEAGLVETSGGQAASRMILQPYDRFVFVIDQPIRILKEKAGRDFVMGIGGSTTSLAKLTIRRPVDATLDLGTGCGVQAMLAAGHSRKVVALDRNERAVHLTRFNANINLATHFEARSGNLFEPVESEDFDLIVSNPPFVISPQSKYMYRDSGMERDQVCETIVRAAPRRLREGGYCQMLVNWAHYANQPWQDRLKQWFVNSGCDAWIICSRTWSPPSYATMWLTTTETTEPAAFAKLFDEWMAYYEHHKIEGISTGVIVMRRRAAESNWFYAGDAPETMVGPCGDDVLATFQVMDYLESTPNEMLLGEKLRVAHDVRLFSQCDAVNGRWQYVASQVRRMRGFAYSGDIDPVMSGLLIRFDGANRVRDLIANMADDLDVPFDRIASQTLALVRGLIQRGFLLPAPFADSD